MALFIHETTTSVADLVSKLNTFLTTAGGGNPAWTADRHNAGAGEWAISKAALGTNTNDIQVAFQWDTGAPDSIGVYQYNHASGAGNYNVGRAGPWDQDGDSGNGFAGTADASIVLDRHVAVSTVPAQYWAFVSQSPVEAVNIVVQTSALTYAHLNFGELEKFNDWTGGAYCCGYRFTRGTTTSTAVRAGSTTLLDALTVDGGPAPDPSTGMEQFMATLQITGLPNQEAGAGTGMWAVVGGDQSALGTDRQSNSGATDADRSLFLGGFRGNEIARSFGGVKPSPITGFVPGYPITCFYWNKPSEVYGPMGVMSDVRGINMANWAPGDEIVVGGDTWVIFPTRFKNPTNPLDGGSGNQGIMYKKN